MLSIPKALGSKPSTPEEVNKPKLKLKLIGIHQDSRGTQSVLRFLTNPRETCNFWSSHWGPVGITRQVEKQHLRGKQLFSQSLTQNQLLLVYLKLPFRLISFLLEISRLYLSQQNLTSQNCCGPG